MDCFLQCMVFLEAGILLLHGTETDLSDYCMHDGFHAECPIGEILLIQEALYGRMEYIHCLTYDMGLHCQSDVLSYMDSWCSGQRTCRVELKIFLLLTDNCHPLAGFLRVGFTCLPVIGMKDECCRMAGEHTILHMDRGYTAGNIEDIGCLENTCPMTIQVSRGQHMTLSIYNFNHSSQVLPVMTNDRTVYQESRCFANVNIKEEGLEIGFPLCVTDARKQHVYTSSTNHVEVIVVTKEGINVSRVVLIFEVIGCPDPVPPENGFVQRTGNHVSIRCTGLDDVSWELTCQNNNWHGSFGNCTEGVLNDVEMKTTRVPKLYFTPGVAIALILSLALIISITIIVIGIVCVRRFRDNNAILERDRFASSQCKTYITERQSVDMPKRCDFIEIQDMEQSRSEPNLLVNDMRNKIPDYSTNCSHNVPNYTQRNLAKQNDFFPS